MRTSREHLFERCVAIDAIFGLEKLTFGPGAGDTDDLKDHGVVTAYVGAAADA